MGVDYNKIDKAYFDSINEPAEALAKFRRQFVFSKEYQQNARTSFPIDLHSFDNEARVYFCLDVLNCSHFFNCKLEDDSRKSFGLLLLCYHLLCDDYMVDYGILMNWQEIKSNLLQMLLDIMPFRSKTYDELPLIVPIIMGKRHENDIKKYKALLLKWATAVANSDGQVTQSETRLLSILADKPYFVKQPATSSFNNTEPVEFPFQEDKDVSPAQGVLDKAYSDLDSLIGLDTVKEQVKSYVNFVKVQQARKSMGMKTNQMSYHCVFLGNPGTGKTTVARILADIFRGLGIIKTGHLIETDRSGLVGQYIGETAIKTNRIIDSALNGVLFIDEAYALSEGGNNDFGKEAISTLIKRMEDDRECLVVILAGYTENMQKFMEINPGLQSRISKQITFPDYSENELFEVFKAIARNNEYTLSASGEAKLRSVIHNAYLSKGKSFGNARFVRNLFEHTIEKQANRVAMIADINQEALSTLTEEDF